MTKQITFFKYQGTGNDFVITSDIYDISTEQIQHLCDRKFGIGADGLIVMRQGDSANFQMMYYNSDGTESFCGNGSRCAVMHAKHLGWVTDECTFDSNDGTHTAEIHDDLVHLHMHDVEMVLVEDEGYILNTGSPHYIAYSDELEDLDILPAAHAIRYNEMFTETGINVNFLESKNGVLHIRTYERGVEDETLSCGTGVTAVALAMHSIGETEKTLITLQTQGGDLQISFNAENGTYNNVWLIGPAKLVFQGNL